MIVYKCTNKINNKIYIGVTTLTLEERVAFHEQDSKIQNSYFYQEINRYGFENFKWEVIDVAETDEELDEKERYYIKLYDTFDNKEKGYNSTSGGRSGFTFTEEEKRKRSIRARGKNNPMYGTVGPMYGKNFTDEHKEKISNALKGSYRPHVIGANNPSAKKVRNVDTGETFETMKDANIKYPKASTSAICGVCKGRGKTAGGFRWEYVLD